MVELVIAWSGKSMGKNSNWEEDPFLKNMFWLPWQGKFPKRYAILPYTHILNFAHAGKLRMCFTSMILLVVCSSFTIRAPGNFYHYHSPMLGLPQTAGNLLSVKSMHLDLLCISTSCGQSFFTLLRLRISFWVMIYGWVSPPTFLLHFSTVCQAENRFWALGVVLSTYHFWF